MSRILFFALLLFTLSCNTATTEKETDQEVVETVVEKKVQLEPIIVEKKLPDYDTTIWTDILFLDTTIQVDMKYATIDNFVKEKMYNCSRCFLRPEVAQAVIKAQQILVKKGYGLKMLDCYRPRPIQQKLWDKVPNASYVTPPSKGSMHNRGSAVDLTLVDSNGKELDMGTGFDYFGKEAHQDYLEHPQEILDNRELLRETMRSVGLFPIRTEWWHYYFAKGAPKNYELADMIWECDH